ncbi:hypothetical protein TB1_042326 [Malus domestica]
MEKNGDAWFSPLPPSHSSPHLVETLLCRSQFAKENCKPQTNKLHKTSNPLINEEIPHNRSLKPTNQFQVSSCKGLGLRIPTSCFRTNCGASYPAVPSNTIFSALSPAFKPLR